MRGPRFGTGPAVLLVLLSLGQPVRAQDGLVCALCHGDPAVFRGQPDSARLVVPREVFERSVHGALGLRCEDCHQGYGAFPHAVDSESLACGDCHVSEDRQYGGSLHGYALERGNERAPACQDCHGVHDALRSTDPASRTHHTRIAATCTACHGEGGLLTDQYLKLPAASAEYAQSVHAREAEAGGDAASCTDCHGVHDLKGHTDPTSRIHPANVSATCGRCHEDIAADYDRSIHGRAVAAGIGDSPTCNDCHGEHLILSPDDPEARTFDTRQARDLCGDCHNDPVIIAKYSLQEEVVGSYVDSYHGWVTRGGNGFAATCVSCHSAHLVLPKADPESSVHDSNVVETCGQCHENVDLSFARSYDHFAASVTRNPINRVIRKVYIGLIVIVIGGMLLHNAVIINYYLAEKRRRDMAENSVVRFSEHELLQHMLLVVAFITLVITGFALRYPEAWWVRLGSGIGLGEGTRSTVHRVAGVALILLSVWHVMYMMLRIRGRVFLRGMAPRWTDFQELVANLRFHVWKSAEGARFARFGYPEKAEYWALIWGTVIMVLTGLILWFPTEAVKLFPAWIVTASQTVHFYEAWLATLAIVVWHFFFVIFHPDVYPMSWTWLTGRMSLEDVEEHHPRWTDEEVVESPDVTLGL